MATHKPSSYDAFKEFEGKRYTGMKVGRGHKWHYDAGDWKEKKVTPERWEFEYAVTKRRAGRAPEGSGAPTGTSHHWYILAHQTVTKLDANSYSTDMKGLKFKVAHQRADKGSWSASDRAQRKRVIQILKEAIAELENEEAPALPSQPVTPEPVAPKPVAAKAPAPKVRVPAPKPRRTRAVRGRRRASSRAA
jgi:hypothetical protein